MFYLLVPKPGALRLSSETDVYVNLPCSKGTLRYCPMTWPGATGLIGLKGGSLLNLSVYKMSHDIYSRPCQPGVHLAALMSGEQPTKDNGPFHHMRPGTRSCRPDAQRSA